MTDRERSRAFARGVGIALVAGWAGLPLGAAPGGPGHLVAGAGAPTRSIAAATGPSLPELLPDILPPSRRDEPFDLPRSGGPGAYAAKWRAMTAALDHDSIILAECRKATARCSPAAQHLLALVEAARVKQGRARLGEVNRGINLAIRYQSDSAQHGAADAWASPLATLSSGRGDCEDFAIAKYLALREAGVPPGDLRLVVVRDTKLRQDHAVLAARLDDRWLVLDNRRLLLLEDDDARDYVPVTAFGHDTAPRVVAADGRERPRDDTASVAPDATRPDPDRS